MNAAQTIRRLPSGAAPADVQLAGGAALLAGVEQSGAPAMRWFSFDPPALLLGLSQRPHEVDAAACAAAGIAVHKRRSGGGAVLGDATLLLLDIALPRAHPLSREDVTEAYRWLGEVWAAALRGLGLDARAVSIAEARADARALDPLLGRVCFGGLSPYEVAVGGRKVVGLAQVRRRAGALFQCGVYLRFEPARTASLMAASPAERVALARQLASRVAGLEDLSGQAPGAGRVTAAFEEALARHAGLSPADDGWTPAEREARQAEVARYAPLSS